DSDQVAGGHLDWTTDAGTISNGTLTDAIGSLATGASATINLSAPTTTDYSNVLDNIATVTASNETESLTAEYIDDVVASSTPTVPNIVAVGLVPGRDFGVAGYNADGSSDPSFGTNGFVDTSFDTGNAQAWATAIQPDGKIVVAGTTGSDFALARYN